VQRLLRLERSSRSSASTHTCPQRHKPIFPAPLDTGEHPKHARVQASIPPKIGDRQCECTRAAAELASWPQAVRPSRPHGEVAARSGQSCIQECGAGLQRHGREPVGELGLAEAEMSGVTHATCISRLCIFGDAGMHAVQAVRRGSERRTRCEGRSVALRGRAIGTGAAAQHEKRCARRRRHTTPAELSIPTAEAMQAEAGPD
jgi:hypothetical protein